jgi:hypothetical protein
MNKLIELFSIVPVGDGYHYLCKDNDGNYFERNKNERNTNERLIFESKALAKAYIDKYLDAEKYEPGFIWYRDDCIPNNVIRNV